MNAKVGNKEILARERFIIPQDEVVEFEFKYNEELIKIQIGFAGVPAQSGEMGSATWQIIEGGIKFVFMTASTTPVVIRSSSFLGVFSDNSKLHFYAEFYKYASSGVVFIQLFNNKELYAPKKV